MITPRELRQIAGRYGLNAGQAEHEYAMLCVLDALWETSPLSDTFCLKGGTALRLAYFADWRHSVDLDFSVMPPFPSAALRSHIEAWFDRANALHGITIRVLDYHSVNGAVRMRAQYVGPLEHPARLLFDVTLDEPVLLAPQARECVIPWFMPLRPVVLAYALEEILAEKMRSILQRAKSRDYYDVWRLLKEERAHLDIECVRAILGDKCRHREVEAPCTAAFLVPQRLEEASIYWERDLARQVTPQSLPDWADVTDELAELLAGFFEVQTN